MSKRWSIEEQELAMQDTEGKWGGEEPPPSKECTIAYCKRCGGFWSVTTDTPLDQLEGACMECDDRDTEQPLMFARISRSDLDPFWDELPDGWLAR